MKTKDMIILMTTLATVGCHAYEPEGYTKEYWHAMRRGAEAKTTIEVVDEIGHPVTNANTRVFFRMSSGPSEGKRAIGVTDGEGKFMAEGRTTDSVFIAVEKDGYYATHVQYNAASRDPERLKDGRWLPWNPTIPVVLRDTRNPTPMFVTNIYKHSIPSETPMGFDCVNQDWVAPHGKGVVTDFLVTFSPVGASEYDGACRIVLSSTDKEGGFIPKQKKSYSEFVSEYEAPVEGYSEVNIVRETKMKFYERNPSDLPEDEYLIFKSRIVRDKAGVIVSANYGKIYGKMDYVFSRNKACGALGFTYYFNPKPNDPNLEFDGKHNLFLPQYDTSNHAP